MIFSLTSIASLAISALIAPAMANCPAPAPTPNYFGSKHLEQVKDNYLDIWNGNLSLINSTFAPTLSFHADRFPTTNSSELIEVQTREEFSAFVERSRASWDSYTFTVHAWVGNNNNIAVRWILNAIVGSNFTLVPTTLKEGDPVTYNGTDFLILNENTGLVEELNIAQDLISFFHNLGLTEIPV